MRHAPARPALPMIDCDAVMRQLWDFLDGELPPERLAMIEDHVRLCGRCRPHADFERAFKTALRAAHRNEEASATLGRRVRDSLLAQGFEDPR